VVTAVCLLQSETTSTAFARWRRKSVVPQPVGEVVVSQ
jgi:hypothetical protein